VGFVAQTPTRRIDGVLIEYYAGPDLGGGLRTMTLNADGTYSAP
jgi:hypothetical protein